MSVSCSSFGFGDASSSPAASICSICFDKLAGTRPTLEVQCCLNRFHAGCLLDHLEAGKLDGKCKCARYLLSHGLSPDSPNDAEMTARQLCTVDTTGPEADELGPGPVYAEMLAVIESWTELSRRALPAV